MVTVQMLGDFHFLKISYYAIPVHKIGLVSKLECSYWCENEDEGVYEGECISIPVDDNVIYFSPVEGSIRQDGEMFKLDVVSKEDYRELLGIFF